MDDANKCPMGGTHESHEDELMVGKCPFHSKKPLALGMMPYGENPTQPQNQKDIDDKQELYNYYTNVSRELRNYIEKIGGFDIFFGSNENHFPNLRTSERSANGLKDVMDEYFIYTRNHVSIYMNAFFASKPELTNTGEIKSRYDLRARFERSVMNTHFVSLLYLYCYCYQFYQKFNTFPILDELGVKNLLDRTRQMCLLLAAKLEMLNQMSHLRTLTGSPIEQGLSEKVRESNMVFPSDGGANGFSLSSDFSHLEMNPDGLSETRRRVEVALSTNSVPGAGEHLGCPALVDKLLDDMVVSIRPQLKKIISHFTAQD